MNNNKKVLIWLSWWVDSAVSAYLLKEQWYDVTAGFMINYRAPEWEYCPTKEDKEEAIKVAKFLDIPFMAFDYVEEYSHRVLDYMYEWYKKGITPNPDIMCNSEVKFKVFLEEALKQWYDYIAMWHYAKIEEDSEWYFHLKKWVDEDKDQSYFLSWLNQKQLSKALFPLGNIKKTEVREIAEKIWLPNAKRKDSQWICFVWKVDLSKFLEKKIAPKPWKILDTSWNILWEHNWVYYYTIWQRKGLNLWWQKEPYFVVKKNIDKNEIIVWTAFDLDLFWKELFVKDFHIIWDKNKIKFPYRAKAKIRYRQLDQDCTVYKEDDWYRVEFENEQRAIAEWQVCVIYNWDDLVMSWVIV